MKPSDALAAHRKEIREIVLAHRTSNARVFGSVVHGSDTEESDLDILVDTTQDTTLFDLGAVRYTNSLSTDKWPGFCSNSDKRAWLMPKRAAIWDCVIPCASLSANDRLA